MSYLVRIYDRATDADRQVGPGLTLGEALHAAYVLLPVAPHSRLMVRTGSPIALSLTLLLRLDTGGVNVIGHPDLSIVDRAIDDEFACLAAAVGRLQWAVTHAETEAVVAAARGRLARPPVGRLTRRTDRFRCPWLHSVLTAGTCVARQDAVHEGGRNDRTRPRATPTHPACVACAQVTGEGTAATAPTESPAPTAARTCAVDGCPHPVPVDAPALTLCDGCKEGWL